MQLMAELGGWLHTPLEAPALERCCGSCTDETCHMGRGFFDDTSEAHSEKGTSKELFTVRLHLGKVQHKWTFLFEELDYSNSLV